MALSTEDITLLREVFRAARAKGWSRAADCGEHEWSGQEEHSANVTLVSDGESDRFELRVYEWAPRYRCVQLPHPTVREAVDLLVLLGILPSEFSSAYRAGRRAASKAVSEMPAYLGDEGWGRMADLAENAGYPRRLVTDRRKRDDYTTVTIESAYQYGYRHAAEVAR